MVRNIVKRNFWRFGFDGDKNLYQDQIGWSESSKADAQSDYSEYIFRYYIETVGLNMLFYWLKDGCFYTIETELDPIEVRRIFPNKAWDGSCEFTKADSNDGPCTSSAGDIIATFETSSQIWDNLKIGDVPIGEVIEHSVIITLD